jgi:peptide chain release factor 2
MLIDDLCSRIKSVEPDLSLIKQFYKKAAIEESFNELSSIVNNQDFWKHPDQVRLSREFQKVKQLRQEYDDIITAYDENNELVELFKDNEEELLKLEKDIKILCKRIRAFKLSLLLNEEDDDKNCFFSINAGAGGTESQDWAEMLLRMYLRFCERELFQASLVDYQTGEEAGIKSATLYVKGKNATGFLKTEEGIHRLVRISPFDSNNRRHTSFAAVSVTPELPDVKIDINEDDLRIDTYRAGGAGGQHVNKTDSAVRITHLPTKIVVQCQNERSQLQNKQIALKMLKAKLLEKQREEEQAKKDSVKKKKIEWGSQIRSYILHPYKMVKDHRTNYESHQPDDVLDGDLMAFIEAQLLSSA